MAHALFGNPLEHTLHTDLVIFDVRPIIETEVARFDATQPSWVMTSSCCCRCHPLLYSSRVRALETCDAAQTSDRCFSSPWSIAAQARVGEVRLPGCGRSTVWFPTLHRWSPPASASPIASLAITRRISAACALKRGRCLSRQ